jgi:Flp pilus assembly protein TadG
MQILVGPRPDWRGRCHRHHHHRRRGANALEMAVVMPLLCFFMLATITMGMGVHRYQ